MKATDWEFNNRAFLFGMVFALGFPLYAVDQRNSTEALARWLGQYVHIDAGSLTRLSFALAAIVLVIAAFLRTWASSYLHADVVYATKVKAESLVADGPYRHVRNPLYLANVLMAVAMGSIMSRAGFVVSVVAMWFFSYRLILREEAELAASQGDRYRAYCERVPRLWPSLRARVAASGQQPKWGQGFKAELWYWGFAASLVSFAATLKLKLFFIILAASIAVFWLISSLLAKKSKAQGAGS
jgi:protein-S-isoprenylcysteine O-methyltransferase Ste14